MTTPHSEMEPGGYYNAHSKPQASAGSLGLPILTRAAQNVPIEQTLLAMCDMGCAQGSNSMMPMGAAVAAIRARSTAVPIAVTHTDIPSNDFTSLFELLASPQSYLAGTNDVYAYAAGVSFYERMFAERTQTLGWNSIAIHWLSSVPCHIPDNIWSNFAQGAAHDALRQRAAQDWQNFLNARAAEFVAGGQIVVVASCANDQGLTGAEGIMTMANDQLLAMVRQRKITSDQYDAMIIPTYYRTQGEFEAPFSSDSPFELVESTPAQISNPLWAAFQSSHNAQTFAAATTAFLRAFSEPCLFAGIAKDVADEFYSGFEQRVLDDPSAASANWRLLLLRVKRRS